VKRTAVHALVVTTLALSSLSAYQVNARTTRDGVFTAEQATRGRALYGEQCAACHGPALGGVEMAPPLAGSEFYGNWSDVPLDDLFQRIVLTMPQAKPGSLSRRQSADLVAFILGFNKAPTGAAELSSDADVLKTIRIVPTN
jgi:quinoprotein glucose dehydrogenase